MKNLDRHRLNKSILIAFLAVVFGICMTLAVMAWSIVGTVALTIVFIVLLITVIYILLGDLANA